MEVADIDKRAFLKLIGATGISFFLFSLLGRRVEVPFFGRAVESGTNPVEGQPTDGYKISEIDDNTITYYGFTNKDGAWLIMREDTEASSFRYVKGDLEFSGNWSNRENLKYDYFHEVF